MNEKTILQSSNKQLKDGLNCYYVGAKLFGLGNHIYLVFKNELYSTDIQKPANAMFAGF